MLVFSILFALLFSRAVKWIQHLSEHANALNTIWISAANSLQREGIVLVLLESITDTYFQTISFLYWFFIFVSYM